MKKACAVSSILLLLIAIPFLPHKLVRDPESIQFVRIYYLGDKVDERDIDTEQMLHVLSSIQRRRIYGQSVRSIEGDVIELNFRADDKPVHMVFGRDNFCYHSAGILRYYQILDADIVQDQIMAAIHFD